MQFDYVKEKLNECQRSELRDHAFGDREVAWLTETGEVLAEGYFSGRSASVSFLEFDDASFEGDEARELAKCGTLGSFSRNDETGPDEFQEGVTMPALTLEGVRQELTTPVEEL